MDRKPAFYKFRDAVTANMAAYEAVTYDDQYEPRDVLSGDVALVRAGNTLHVGVVWDRSVVALTDCSAAQSMLWLTNNWRNDQDHHRKVWEDAFFTNDVIAAIVKAIMAEPAPTSLYWAGGFDETPAGKLVAEALKALQSLTGDVLNNGELRYVPADETKGKIYLLENARFLPQAVSTLLTLREILDVEIWPKIRGDACLDQCIRLVDEALIGYHNSNFVSRLRLQTGNWVDEGCTGNAYVGKFEPDGEGILIDNTPWQLAAAAALMNLSVESLQYALEDDGECSTQTHRLRYESEENHADATQSTDS
jgi:hypothetical protein